MIEKKFAYGWAWSNNVRQVKPQNYMLVGKDMWNNVKALHVCGKIKKY